MRQRFYFSKLLKLLFSIKKSHIAMPYRNFCYRNKHYGTANIQLS